jgi:tetratricopeptide (TPR) repeat protein
MLLKTKLDVDMRLKQPSSGCTIQTGSVEINSSDSQEVVIMNARVRLPILLAALCLLPASAIPQGLGSGASVSSNPAAVPMLGDSSRYNFLSWTVSGRVTTLRGDPVSGARVVVVPTNTSSESRSLLTNLQGEFVTEYSLNVDLVRELVVDVMVTKKGFLRAHTIVDFGDAGRTWLIPVTLRQPEEDPDLLSQADLISGLAPQLKKLKASDGLSAAGEKDYARGAAEFLESNKPDRALPYFTKVTHRDVTCLQCRTMLALAQLDSGDWDGAQRNLVEVVTKIQADTSLGRPEPLVALGVMQSWQYRPKNAAAYFVEALKYGPQDVLALQELGRSQLLIQNWGAADEYLGKALSAGAKPEVRLLYIEALLGASQFQAANTEMARYLNGRDVKTMPLRVRQLWAEVENRKKIEATYAKAKSAQRLDYLRHPPLDLEGLVPATDQKDLDSILKAVGQNVAESFAKLPNTSSLEEIHQEKLVRKQKVGATLDQKFRYLCFTPDEDFGPGFNEYRADLSGLEAAPKGLGDGFMLTSGFASAALVFHPMYQPQADFRYIGRQKVNGRDTYLVAFAQQPAKARLNGTFKSGGVSLTTFTQGLAWIDSHNDQIIRLRTDLLRPLQEVNLEGQTTEIAFSEVHFKGMEEGFWVPQNVSVTVDWNGKHLRNEHHYSEYKLFQVEATEKHGKPKEVSQTPK